MGERTGCPSGIVVVWSVDRCPVGKLAILTSQDLIHTPFVCPEAWPWVVLEAGEIVLRPNVCDNRGFPSVPHEKCASRLSRKNDPANALKKVRKALLGWAFGGSAFLPAPASPGHCKDGEVPWQARTARLSPELAGIGGRLATRQDNRILHHETYLPSFQDPSRPHPWLSGPHEDPWRPRRHQRSPRQGSQAPGRLTANAGSSPRLTPRIWLPPVSTMARLPRPAPCCG
jgi:hypothetical protein